MSIIKVVSKKAKKGYTYKVTFKYKENGVTTSYSKSGFITKKEARDHENIIKAEIKRNGCLKKECTKTLNQIYKEWLEVENNSYALHTIETYSYLYMKYVKDNLGKKRIKEIKYKEVQQYFNELDKGKSLCDNLRKVLRCVFVYAVKNEYIEDNVIQYVKITNKKESKNDKEEYLKHSDYLKIVEQLRKEDFRYKALAIAIEIGYHTGLRISEIFALNKDDFDLKTNMININKQIESQKGKRKKDYTTTPFLKTSSSYDTVPITPKLKASLIEWFECNPYERVICDKDGYYLCVYNANTWIKNKIKHLGVNFHFHMLRHTFITNLYKNNVDLKTAQKLARHSDIKTTLNVYTHIQDSHKTNALNDVFKSIYSKNAPKTEISDMVN
ncbi:tyrosine-type recombinase/integrase [Thomasclavelia cocleata]|uniref:tyrosine-type recombinase/integrase n=1 Tax=Thomasclavelia cocleata TaxID=69824 RepID=UPI002557F8B5|nr:site-specific integrase [Thomasclavelia cocleata]